MAIMACRGRGGAEHGGSGWLEGAMAGGRRLSPKGCERTERRVCEGVLGRHADSKKKLSLGSNIVIKICITCQI